VQRGDSVAFDLLVRKYQHRIAALISRYIHDWSRSPGCRPGHLHPRVSRDRELPGLMRSSTPGCTGIAVNTAKNHLVAHNRRPPTDDIDVTDAEQFDSASACATPTPRNAN
jgi:RNA polymerase sigma-70 factor (ECF subfamily)